MPTVKGSSITPSQTHWAQLIIGVGKGLSAPGVAMTAAIYAAIWESGLGQDMAWNGTQQGCSMGYGGVLAGCGDTYSQYGAPTSDAVGIAEAKDFFSGNSAHGYQAGGAIYLAGPRQGVTNPIEIAVRVEVPSIWPSNAYAAESGYPGDSAAVAEAAAIVNAYLPGATATTTPAGTTSPNQTSASPWTVGNSSNPDQDYWTTINQYCQQAQWYCASDGERLIIADGIQLMGQTPRAVISRYDPAVLEMDATYDNSAFSYTTKHIKKGGLASPAALTKVTSPTSVTVKVICDIDAFQAMDTVGLADCGPASGAWLIGQTRRSVFQPYTELTLVQGMQPLNALTGTPFSGTPGATPTAPGSNTYGAYVNPFAKASGVVASRIDMGVDFSMAIGSPILAIGNCKVVGPPAGSPNATNWYAGQPMMVMQFLDGPKKGAYWYIAEQITESVGLGSLVNAGAELAKYAPSGTAIETGWAASSSGQTLSQANGTENLHPHHANTPEGISFAQFLVALGVTIKLPGFTG